VTDRPNPDKDDPWLGQTLAGKYRLDERLGEGGFGTAYLAADLNYQKLMGGERLVVVKLPRLDRLDEGQGLPKDFRKEAHALTQLEHAHIVKVLDVGTQTVTHLGREREIPFLVLQYASGKSLEARLEAHGGIQSLSEVLEWLPDVARALDYLHAQASPVLHRDVKPGNILFDAAGSALLADFGIAKIFSVGSVTGGLPGSPLYMAPDPMLVPERSDGGGEVLDGRYDQYALAVTVYEALSGRLPHEPTSWASGRRSSLDEHSASRLVYRKTKEPPVSLRLRAPHIPASVASAIERALAMKRDDRYSSCRAFAAAVAEAAIERSPTTVASLAPSPTTLSEPAVSGRASRPKESPAPATSASSKSEGTPTKSVAARSDERSGPEMAGGGRRRSGRVLAVLFLLVVAGGAAYAFRDPLLSLVARTTPPARPIDVDVLSPAEGALLTARSLRVSGRADGPAGLAVRVNGTPATIQASTFSAEVEAPGDGPWQLTVEATAPDGRSVSVVRNVTVDSTPPVVELTSPTTKTVPNAQATMDVVGTVTDANPTEVRIGTKRVSAKGGAFRLDGVPLAAGADTSIEIEAFDIGGLASTVKTIVVHREAPPPPVVPWKAPLAAAIDAAAHGRWSDAKALLDDAVAREAPVKEIPDDLRRGIEDDGAIRAAEALARAGNWEEAQRRMPTGPLPASISIPPFLSAGLRPAKVTLQAPVDGARVASFDVEVRGVLDGRAGDRISCLGKTYAPDEHRAFSFTLTLSGYGNQSIEIRAVDQGGASRSEPVRVQVQVADPRPATLTLDSPLDSDVLYADAVTVRGRIDTPRSTDVVEVGGKTARVTGGRFEADVPRSTASSVSIVVRNGDAESARANVRTRWFDGKQVPDFRGTTIEGSPISPALLRGSWFVLEWVNPICDITMDNYENQDIQRYQKMWSQKGVKWFIVCSTEMGKKGFLDDAGWAAWKAKYRVSAPSLVVDRFGDIERAFGVKESREVVVADPTGRILHQGVPDNWHKHRRAKFPPPTTIPHDSSTPIPYEDNPTTEPATNFVDLMLSQAFAKRSLSYPSGVTLAKSGWA
jgi:serine/threonine protein kinase